MFSTFEVSIDVVVSVPLVTNLVSAIFHLKFGVFPAIAANNESSPCLMISSTIPNEELTLALSVSLPEIEDDTNCNTLPALTLAYVLPITVGSSTI